MSKTFKLVVVGNGYVGKTSLLMTYATGKFPIEYVPTVFENYLAQIKIDQDPIKVSLWDTAGQEEFDAIRPLSYPQTDVFLIVFSTVDKISYEDAINTWYPEVQKIQPKTYKIFVGTKIDLRKNDENHIQFNKAFQEINKLNCKYMECSSLTQQGLNTVFEESIRKCIPKKRDYVQLSVDINQDESCKCSVF